MTDITGSTAVHDTKTPINSLIISYTHPIQCSSGKGLKGGRRINDEG
jgi:hypothetical protein